MNDSLTMMVVTGCGLAGLSILLFALLRGWQGWLELKRLELAGHQQQGRSPAIERIEVADLKERIRKLESIASCIDL